MHTKLCDVVQYSLEINGLTHNMNDLIGKNVKIEWKGKVICKCCNKEMSKFYRSGFCYKCYWKSPMASQSIFKPELCTAHLNIEERDLDWERKFQITPHYVYLSNSKDKSRYNTQKSRSSEMDRSGASRHFISRSTKQKIFWRYWSIFKKICKWRY